jgi:DNA-binding HxlR family transcriptional regulator
VRTYGQYCPILRASEIFAERWTPVIIRNVLLGCRSFTAILNGAPGLSRTLLSQRLRELERVGIIVRSHTESGVVYEPTSAGRELWDVCETLGKWGARWLDVAPEHLDPYVVLWSMCNSLAVENLPAERVVVRFEFPDQAQKKRFWLLLDHGSAEVCLKPPGGEDDLVVTCQSEAFALWHMGRRSWTDTLRSGQIHILGPRPLALAFPTWNRLSHFAAVPRASEADSGAGDLPLRRG